MDSETKISRFKLSRSWLIPALVIAIIAAIIVAFVLASGSSQKTDQQSKNTTQPNSNSTSSNGSSNGSKNSATPSLSLASSSGSGPDQNVSKGSEVVVEVWADSSGQPVNAVQTVLSYPKDKLKYVSIDASGSAFSVAANSKSSDGTVTIARGNPEPISGRLLVAKVHFIVLGDLGKAPISFGSGTALVSAKTHQNILDTTQGTSYRLTP